MDDKMKALEDAAFHAWIVLGEVLLDFKEPRPTYRTSKDEIQTAYAALQEALEALKEKPR